jgi:hypothetical protein
MLVVVNDTNVVVVDDGAISAPRSPAKVLILRAYWEPVIEPA